MTQHSGLFITATDTGVGKTYVSALIARSLAGQGVMVGAYKPVCSGAEAGEDGKPAWNDVATLHRAIGETVGENRICAQRFMAPLAPPISARLEGRSIDWNRMVEGARWWRDQADILIVEGVGGLLCPLTEDRTIADFAVELGYPLLIVGRLGLGTINHTLLTIEAARLRGLSIAGVLLNEAEPAQTEVGLADNLTEIERRGDVPVLGATRFDSTIIEKPFGAVIDFPWREWIQHSSAPLA